MGFCLLGANLIIISRTKKDLDEVSKKIKKLKSKCRSYVCDITNYDEIKEIIDNVTLDDVNKLAKELLDPSKLHLTIIGPYKDNQFSEKYQDQNTPL